MSMFVIYTSGKCPWCEKAKSYLAHYGHTFEERPINDRAQSEHLLFLLENKLRTVPQIFNEKGEYVGGYDDLVTYLGQPELPETVQNNKEVIQGEVGKEIIEDDPEPPRCA